MTKWRSMFEMMMPNTEKPATMSSESAQNFVLRLREDNAVDVLLRSNGREGDPFSEMAGVEEGDCNDPAKLKSLVGVMMISLRSKDDAIVFLEKKLLSAQREAMVFKEEELALKSENMLLRRELSENRAREEALEKYLEQVRRKKRILEEAEERLCAQLADVEAETLQQSGRHKAELRKLNSELQQKRALIASLAADIDRYRSTREASSTVASDASMVQLSEAKSQLESTQQKYSEALTSLKTAESENSELKSVIDTLKAEMLRLDSAKRTHANLLKNTQKELDSFKGKIYPIQVEATEVLFDFKSPRALLVGACQTCSA